MSRWGYTAYAGISLLIALLSWRMVMAPVEQVMPHMAHFVSEAPWRLWAHLLGAPLAMILAPVQVWSGLRMRWPALHRWTGRLYGLAVLIGGLAALFLAPASDASLFARLGFMTLAALWLGTTAIGITLAMRGDLVRHRWWMKRSLALTFAAVTLRLAMMPLIAAGWTVAETYDVTAWGSWVLNLAVLEWWQRRSVGVARLV